MTPTQAQKNYSDVDSRLATVEGDIRNIGSQMTDLRLTLGRVADRLNEVGKTSWNTILAALTLGVVIITAIGSAWITPINKDVVHLQSEDQDSKQMRKELLQRVTDAEHMASTNNARVKEQLKEIETQFDWQTDTARMSRAYINQMISILWERSFGTKMPDIEVSEFGPMGRGKDLTTNGGNGM